jgi:hypothetical protein
MKVLFCHGLEGSPSGRKATALRDAGHEVVAPPLPKEDFEQPIRTSRGARTEFRPDMLVGSSRGGAVAMRVASASVAPLVPLASAWRRCGVEPAVRHDTRILHGIKDDVVPLADSIEREARPAGSGVAAVRRRARRPPRHRHPAVARAAGYPSHDRTPRHGRIVLIRPYRWNGVWVFDDSAATLDKEAFIAGMPELIEMATAREGFVEPEKGLAALFSEGPFPGAQACLERVREEAGGTVYRWPEAGKEGWLCPALLRYFGRAPERLYVEVWADDSG